MVRKVAGQPSDTSTIITDSASQINCAAIPDAELTTIGNQAQCPDEIALREHQRNNNEAKEKASIDKEIEKINSQNRIIKQRLKNLKELFEEELINEQEYDQKKQEILDQL